MLGLFFIVTAGLIVYLTHLLGKSPWSIQEATAWKRSVLTGVAILIVLSNLFLGTACLLYWASKNL